jgi:hypothetical protein
MAPTLAQNKPFFSTELATRVAVTLDGLASYRLGVLRKK